MMHFGSVVFGVMITSTTVFAVKVAYEYGRYSAVHDIHKHGWSVVAPDNEKKWSKNFN